MCLLAKFVCLETVIFNFKSIFSTESVSHLFLLTILIADNHKIFAFKWRKIQYLKQKKGGYDPEADQAIQLDFQKRYYGGGTRSVYGEEGKNPKYSGKNMTYAIFPL